MHPFLVHPAPLAFAHRGGAVDHLENTLAAFEASVALGYRYVETDVHLTADGVLVAFHDERLDRVTDSTGHISELSWTEVAEARVGGAEPIPRFDELLDAFPAVRVNVDAKHDRSVDVLAAAIRRADALERVCIGSFSDDRLARIRELLGPDVCTSAGPREVARMRAASFGLPLQRFSSQCLQVPIEARGRALTDERFIDRAHRHGLQVHVWTIDDPGEMHRLLDLGVDGIMTDRPAELKSVLEQRGQWVDAAAAP